MLNREGLAMLEPEYSEKQVGIIGGREPELCAVSGKPVRGKHAVAHYKGDNVHYVRVLNQYDHRWTEAAPRYGFPVHEEIPAQDENVFVLEGLETGRLTVTDSNGDVTETDFKTGSFPAGNFASVRPVESRRASKLSPTPPPDIKADGMSKGDD
jgi:hypothetical protein